LIGIQQQFTIASILKDGVHLKPKGAEALASLIAEALSEDE